MKKLLKLRYENNPFVNGYTDIEKENTDIEIGGSGIPEDFFNISCFPETMHCLCELIPQKEFNQEVEISARYKLFKESKEEKIIKFKIYDDKKMKTEGNVSSIDVKFLDILEDFPAEYWNYINENSNLFTKRFVTQKSSCEIPNFIDEELGITDIMHFKTNAHCYGGIYHPGIDLADIQPYVFYMGTGYQSSEYIKMISIKTLLNSDKVKLSPYINLGDLTTFVDDVALEKIVIELPNGIVYKSADIQKKTTVSDICTITFKRYSSY